MTRCHQIDGLVDGPLDDPRRCDFDPASIACTGNEIDTCLAAEQIGVVPQDLLWCG